MKINYTKNTMIIFLILQVYKIFYGKPTSIIYIITIFIYFWQISILSWNIRLKFYWMTVTCICWAKPCSIGDIKSWSRSTWFPIQSLNTMTNKRWFVLILYRVKTLWIMCKYVVPIVWHWCKNKYWLTTILMRRPSFTNSFKIISAFS